ncbi:hypothetical protein V4D07_33150 [Paenibacillus taichungensis]
MSILMDDYNNRLNKLHSTLDILLKEYDRLPDAAYQVFSIEAEIRSFELRKDRLNLTFSHLNCSLCKQQITEEDEAVRLGLRGTFLICPRCIRTINQVKGTSELEEQIGLKSPGTIKQDCEGPLKPLQAECLVRKSEKCWLVHDVVSDLFYRVGRRRHNLLHSWIDELSERLNMLQDQKQLLEEIRSFIPDYHTQIYSLQYQIQDLQSKLDRIKGGKLPYRCSQCGVWIKEGGNPTFFGTYTICSNCKEVVSNVMTTSEAEKKHGLTAGTIRRDNSRGLLDKYKKHGLFRLSGKIWLVHDVVILDKYKELKGEEVPVTKRSEIPSDLAQRSASIFNRIMEGKRG